MSPRSGDNIGRQTDRRGDGETGRQAGSQQQVQPLPKKQQKQKTAATADAYSKSLSVVRSSAPYSTVWRCCRCRCAVIVFNLLSHHHHHHLLLLLKASSHSVFSDGVQALGGSGGDGGGGEQQSWQATHSVWQPTPRPHQMTSSSSSFSSFSSSSSSSSDWGLFLACLFSFCCLYCWALVLLLLMPFAARLPLLLLPGRRADK